MELLQINQPQLLKVLIKASPLRWSKGSLAAPTQMPNQPAADVPVHGSFCLARIAKREIVGPSSQLPVDAFYQMGHGYMALPPINHLTDLGSFRLQRLGRRCYIQVSVTKTPKIPVVSERKAQEVQAGPGLPKVNHLRLVPVQLQTKPGLYLRFDKTVYPATRIPRHHHKIIRVADDVGLRPEAGAVGGVKHLFKPMKVHRANGSASISWKAVS